MSPGRIMYYCECRRRDADWMHEVHSESKRVTVGCINNVQRDDGLRSIDLQWVQTATELQRHSQTDRQTDRQTEIQWHLMASPTSPAPVSRSHCHEHGTTKTMTYSWHAHLSVAVKHERLTAYRLHTVSGKKRVYSILGMTSSNTDRFSKFF